MGQDVKIFADHLNICLNEVNAPTQLRERAAVLGKMLDIAKAEAIKLLEGYVPDDQLLQKIANEFEVDKEWLIGKNKEV